MMGWLCSSELKYRLEFFVDGRDEDGSVRSEAGKTVLEKMLVLLIRHRVAWSGER